MGRKRKVSFVDAYNSCETREDQEELINAVKERKKIWAILTLIPFVNWFFGSKLIYCRNTLRAIYGKKPGGLINIIIVLWCFIIPVIIGNWLIEHMPERYQDTVVLGAGKVLKQWSYVDDK